jgi:queuosine precursor transporter
MVGQLMDIWLFGLIKRWTKGKHLWVRSVGSTLISQLLDSFVVSYVAFSLGKKLTGQIPATLAEISSISVTGYGLKFIVTGLVTPILYGMRDLLQNKFGLEPIPADQDFA